MKLIDYLELISKTLRHDKYNRFLKIYLHQRMDRKIPVVPTRSKQIKLN